MQNRHDILLQTIGCLKEEQDALEKGYFLLLGSFILVVIGSLLEAWFFWLYNGSWHPFNKILKDPSKSNTAKCKIFKTGLLAMCRLIMIETFE